MDSHLSRLVNGFDTLSAIADTLPTNPEENRIVGLICQAVGAQMGCLFSMSEDRLQLATRSVWFNGVSNPVELAYSTQGRGVFARVARERGPQSVTGTSVRSLSQSLRERLGVQTDTVLLTPLTQADTVTGAVLCARSKPAAPFTSEDTAIVRGLAQVASLTAENMTLRGEIASLQRKTAKLNAQLLQSAKLAATGKLAASIAHEINNPLQSVQSCIYLVNDGVPQDGPSRQYLDIAREELDRIAKIVQRLADFYRPSQDSQKLADLNTLLDNVLVLMGKRLQQGKVRVTKTLAPELPLVTISIDQMKQVFVNLVLNALEAMPDGGELTVSTRAVKNQHETLVEIAFRDSGVGIAPEALGRIFDPFFSTKAKGTGLGLSISHDIVERHAGVIRVESKPGSGALLTVVLPTASAAAGEQRV
jgi:two-component system, NtrC family, sensor kinase